MIRLCLYSTVGPVSIFRGKLGELNNYEHYIDLGLEVDCAVPLLSSVC